MNSSSVTFTFGIKTNMNVHILLWGQRAHATVFSDAFFKLFWHFFLTFIVLTGGKFVVDALQHGSHSWNLSGATPRLCYCEFNFKFSTQDVRNFYSFRATSKILLTCLFPSYKQLINVIRVKPRQPMSSAMMIEGSDSKRVNS